MEKLMNFTRTLVLFFGVCCGSVAHADFLVPARYDMPNGYGVASTGKFNYWDRFYTGSGNTTLDGAPLSGGVGDLTDGVVAAGNWDQVENIAGTGPYVGWRLVDPLISIDFASVVELSTLSIHFDDSNGSGGVRPPIQVIVNGITFNVADPAGSTPFWVNLDMSLLPAADQWQVRLIRRSEWTMASEFQFQGTAVPEPATAGLLFATLAAGSCRYWRCRSKASLPTGL